MNNAAMCFILKSYFKGNTRIGTLPLTNSSTGSKSRINSPVKSFSDKSYPPFLFRLRRWHHQLPDRLEHDTKMGIVLLLEVIQLTRQVLVRGEHFPQTDESAHDGDVDLDSSFAIQNARQHRNALLGENIG